MGKIHSIVLTLICVLIIGISVKSENRDTELLEAISHVKLDVSLETEFENIYHLFQHANTSMYEMLDQQQVVLHHVSGHGPAYRHVTCKLCSMMNRLASDGFRLENKRRDQSPILVSKDGKIRVLLRGTDMDTFEEVTRDIEKKRQQLKEQAERKDNVK